MARGTTEARSWLATWQQSPGGGRVGVQSRPLPWKALRPCRSRHPWIPHRRRLRAGKGGASHLAGQQNCQGHGWGAVRVPDEERETRETRSVGRAGGRLLLAPQPGSAPGRGRGRPSWQAGWLAGGLEGLVRPSFRNRTPEGVGTRGRGCGLARRSAGQCCSSSIRLLGTTATTRLRLRPYHPERARSRLISEAKQGRAWLVLGWETAWEYRVL